MESVARYLRGEVLRQQSSIDRDLFARSAYNRYYYATFLIARSLMVELNSDWTQLTHVSLPQVLLGSVQNDMKKAVRRARHLADGKKIALISRGTAALRDLSEMLIVAYATRVVADYQPETPVMFSEADVFVLNKIPIAVANSWPDQARGNVVIIKRAWEAVVAR